MIDQQLYIRRCLQLARKGNGMTCPNPMVGAVLVHDGRVIGEGWHQQYGQAHAEVNCLDSVQPEDRILIPRCSMYVNLEPCAHQGKTPSCALRLVAEKVNEVIICNVDPYEQVKGKGIEILEGNGIKTTTSVLKEEGLWLNRRFFCFHQQQRPYIILKWAETEQGFFAPANRARRQMSNKHSQQLVHKWRSEEAAILVGTNTGLSDDPQLTARLWDGTQPIRVVFDRSLKLPGTLKLFNKDAPTWIINEVAESIDDHIRYVKLDFDDNLLAELLRKLHQENILSLIVEGGAGLLDSFIRAGLWDEARVFVTPTILEDGIAAPMLSNAGKAFTSDIDSDALHVYVNKQSRYQYMNGMEL